MSGRTPMKLVILVEWGRGARGEGGRGRSSELAIGRRAGGAPYWIARNQMSNQL